MSLKTLQQTLDKRPKRPYENSAIAYLDFENWAKDVEGELGKLEQKLREILQNTPVYPDDVGGMYPYEIQMYSVDVDKFVEKVRMLLEG